MSDITPSDLPARVERSINAWLVHPSSGWTNKTYLSAIKRIGVATWRLPALTEDECTLIIKLLYERFSDNTVRNTVAAMSSLWSRLAKDGLVASNPWADQKVRTPKDKTAERVLSHDELTAMIEAAVSFRDATFIRFLYYSCLRIEEATSVLWREMYPGEPGPDGPVTQFFLSVRGKGDKTRTVEIPLWLVQDMVKLYRGRIEPDNRVWPFTDRRGRQIVAKTAERAGIEKNVSPHWLRHTGATDAMDAGASLRVVQETLGHASPVTTAKYTHVHPTDRIAGYLPEV